MNTPLDLSTNLSLSPSSTPTKLQTHTPAIKFSSSFIVDSFPVLLKKLTYRNFSESCYTLILVQAKGVGETTLLNDRTGDERRTETEEKSYTISFWKWKLGSLRKEDLKSLCV